MLGENQYKIVRGEGGGVMMKSLGVTIDLSEVVVEGIGFLFASSRHKRDAGGAESTSESTTTKVY
jgi:hypothetical protein